MDERDGDFTTMSGIPVAPVYGPPDAEHEKRRQTEHGALPQEMQQRPRQGLHQLELDEVAKVDHHRFSR